MDLYICPICNEEWTIDPSGFLVGLTQKGIWAPIDQSVGCPWCDGDRQEKTVYTAKLTHWKWVSKPSE